jgi:replication-associated recombination protein RarA
MNDSKQPVNNQVIAGIAQITNVTRCFDAVQRTQDRTARLPGIAAFYGPTGFGKSISASFVANSMSAYYVQAMSTYTKKAFAQAILKEMSLPPARTLHEMIDQIASELAASHKPLIIDEFDHLVSSNKVELVRDIYEGCQGTILIIGEERLPHKLERSERFHARVLNWVPAAPASVEDTKILASIYAPQITISDSVITKLVAVVKGSTRRVSTNLEMLHEAAMSNGIDWVDDAALSEILKQGFVTGESPKPRMF